jgi:N4-gp56 family major capsid protein
MASSGSFATNIPYGSPLAAKKFGAALFALTQRTVCATNSMIGTAPQEAQALAKGRIQTSPDMPIVRITDLENVAGDKVGVDIFGTLTGAPVMGDADAEGTGQALTSASQEIRIDLATATADRGGKMTQKRVVHNLRDICRANLVGYFLRLQDQEALVHAAGARGTQVDDDWIIPLDTATTFADVMINPVTAPAYGHHYLVSGNSLVEASAANYAAMTTTDVLTLDHLDAARTIIDEMPFSLQPVKIVDDPAKNDDPLYLCWTSPRSHRSLISTATANGSLRSFQQNAWNRASYGSKSPLFKGEAGIWNSILTRKIKRSIRFLPGDNIKFVAAADEATGTETTTTAPALGTGYAIERTIIFGAQALGLAHGKSGERVLPSGQSIAGSYFNWLETPYNHGRNAEIAADRMAGMAKIRFDLNGHVRDHGVIVIDSVISLSN